MYIKRAIEETILNLSKQFSCITLYGPRQVGKTTLIEHLFGDSFNKVTMDDLEIRNFAKKNPKEFLEYYKTPLMIDEIQKAPELLEEIKIIIDKHKQLEVNQSLNREILYILTGSNTFELQHYVVESLAGRTAVLNLSSFSLAEKQHSSEFNKFNPDIDILKTYKDFPLMNRKEIFEEIFKGGMPEYCLNEIDRNAFFSSYISTYIEKDVRKIINSAKETDFLKFLQYISLRTGSQVDYNDIARNVGVDARTISSWLSILEASQIIVLLQPYLKNESNRIVKTPKLYFMDTGLCAYLGKWPSADILENGPLAGNFYETFVVSEIIKSFLNNGISNKLYNELSLYYYRDRDQKEVDLIIETFNGIYPIEIKKGINPVSNINFKFLEKYGKKILNGLIIDSASEIKPLGNNVYQCPVVLIGR